MQKIPPRKKFWVKCCTKLMQFFNVLPFKKYSWITFSKFFKQIYSYRSPYQSFYFIRLVTSCNFMSILIGWYHGFILSHPNLTHEISMLLRFLFLTGIIFLDFLLFLILLLEQKKPSENFEYFDPNNYRHGKCIKALLNCDLFQGLRYQYERERK